ncbi:Myosin-11-like protein, partial [Drosera capensis]
IGKTKVFLRAGQMADLDARRAQKLSNAAKTIQRKVRTHITRQKFLALRNATITIQTSCRGRLACKMYESMRRQAAAIKIQKNLCRHLSRKSYQRLQFSAVTLQTGSRAMAARNVFRYKKKTKAAIIIQAYWRSYKAFSYYRKLNRAALVTQCRWRGRLGRKELRKLKMAARETGALKEAKDKLEKKVEELTWRLQFEKRQRTDLEESKEKEISKLQQSLQEMRMKVDEANALVVKEREAARKAVEEAAAAAAAAVKETPVPVEDTEKIDRLTAEVDHLNVSLESERQRANEWEQKYVEAQESSEEKRKKLEETEGRVHQLQDSLNRLEDRLSNLESENKLLRQQALTIAQTNKLLALRSRSIMQRTESARLAELRSQSLVQRDNTEVEGRAQKALNEKQQENQDLLIRCVAQQLGFSKGRPIAACITYKTLKQWRSFQVEKTSIFDRIVQIIGHAIEAQDNNEVLAYWLSNTSYLLLLLQRTLKPSGAAGAPQRRRSTSATLFGRMTQSFRGIPRGVDIAHVDDEMTNGVDNSLSHIEAKYPALLFKQQLTAYVEKIYGMIRDNLKKEISPLLGLCIQAPRTSKVSSLTVGSAAAQQSLFAHWKGIVQSFSNYLILMKANNVPSFLIRKVYTQVFSFVNVQLFNSLLLRRECCSFSNAEYVKAGLAELENWCYDTTEEYAGPAWDELKHIRQAIGFLVIHQKPQKTLDEVSHDLCPVLSIQQLYRISTMYWDDKYGTHSLSPDVIANMKVLMAEDSNNAVSSSFLLDDDSSIPFSVDDLAKSTDQISVSEIEPPPLIRENAGFSFLLPISE